MARLLPGVALAVGIALVAMLASSAIGISAMVLALGLGMVAANFGWIGPLFRPGLARAATTALRCGIVLLGFRLSLGAVADVGAVGVAAVVATVAFAVVVTYSAIRWAGSSVPLAVLLSAGFGICGQSAIAALAPTSDATEEEVGYAIAIVAALGTIAVFALPALNAAYFDLGDTTFGAWVGTSVHDTSQVVAAASVAGPSALATATVIKLTRVLLLGPMLLATGLWNSHRHRTTSTNVSPSSVIRASLPWFTIGFLGAVALRSLGVLPAGFLDAAKTSETLLLSAAMAGLGTSILLRRLVSLGGKPILVGLIAWLAIATWAYAAVMVAGL